MKTYVVVSILLLGIVIAKCCSGEHSPADYTKTRSRLLQLLPNEGGVGGEEAGNDYPINPLIRDGQKKDTLRLHKFVIQAIRRLKDNTNSV